MSSMRSRSVTHGICEMVRRELPVDSSQSSHEVNWDCNTEILLFYAMYGCKPVGLNKNLMMTVILDKFNHYTNKDVPSSVIWEHLDTMYDMAALHESEAIPFANKESPFTLPEDCHELAKQRLGINFGKPENETTDAKAQKKSTTSKTKDSGTPSQSSKSPFVTPTSTKPLKATHGTKPDSKTSGAEAPSRRGESPMPSKNRKGKRSESPSPTKSSKREVKTELPSTPPVRKAAKQDSYTASTSKKTPKVEVPAKKTPKSGKAEPAKRGKPEREVSTRSSTPVDKRNRKPDARKSESERTGRKSSEVASRHKSSRNDESDSSVTSGSRRSSPILREDKKRKRPAETPKRRR